MYDKIWNKNFILLTLSNFFMYITYYAIISMLPIYLVSELHAGKSQVGLVLATYTIACVLIRPFSGFALDKFGRRNVFLLSLILYSLFFSGYLIAISITALIFLRFLQGLTWGVTTISGSTIAVDIVPVMKRGEGIGYFTISTTMGMSIGPIVGSFVCNHWGYTTMFISGLIISILSLACAYAIHLPKKLESGQNIRFNWNNLFDRKSILPSINVFIIMITYGGLLSFIALYGREIGIHNSASFFLVFAIGIIASRFFAGKSFDKNGPNKILTICLIMMIIGFPMLALAKNVVGFYLSALIIGFGIGVIFPTFQTMVSNLSSPEHRGAANSTLYSALDISMGLGMIIAGFIAQNSSISLVFIINAIICIVGLIFFKRLVLNYYEINCNKHLE
jgi:MFS family permease